MSNFEKLIKIGVKNPAYIRYSNISQIFVHHERHDWSKIEFLSECSPLTVEITTTKLMEQINKQLFEQQFNDKVEKQLND